MDLVCYSDHVLNNRPFNERKHVHDVPDCFKIPLNIWIPSNNENKPKHVSSDGRAGNSGWRVPGFNPRMDPIRLCFKIYGVFFSSNPTNKIHWKEEPNWPSLKLKSGYKPQAMPALKQLCRAAPSQSGTSPCLQSWYTGSNVFTLQCFPTRVPGNNLFFCLFFIICPLPELLTVLGPWPGNSLLYK